MATQSPSSDSATLQPLSLTVPASWRSVGNRRADHDDRSVLVSRYQPEPDLRLSGPHLSVVRDIRDGTLLGYTHLTLGSGALPSEEARQAAFEFLDRVDPTHASGLTVQWVDRYDETITECKRPPTRRRWDEGQDPPRKRPVHVVIVGPGNRVITYEREITWCTGAGRRATQMWLHDTWIAAHRGVGPQPDGPVRPRPTLTRRQANVTAHRRGETCD